MFGFIELKLPECEGAGGWSIWAAEATSDGKWYSLIADGSGNLKPPYSQDELDDEHMFNTEQEAHVAANHYYFQHNRTYPFMNEWAAAKTSDSTKGAASQVMEFE